MRAGVAHVRLARPQAANAINPACARDLRAVMLAIEFDDQVKAVCVTAEGPVFCAGGDLREFDAAGDGFPRLASDMLVDYHGAIYKMNRTPKPFVAGVRGAAGGAGLSMVSAFDLVVRGESSKFTMAYARAGVAPDGTSSYFLARHIGLRRMLDLTLTNRVTGHELDTIDQVLKCYAAVTADQAAAALNIRLAYEGQSA
ncbi:enoyl-CoA hydratase/isomerase family protein [Reyranella sp.]|uniref:enoyl-CoA hydratase/isomerase family protein n=1 Tax=Reyranella sp. TaxID=1929291 RepID=UPI003D0CFE4A